MLKYKYVIGIDPGVNTGFAFWNKQDKKFVSLGTHSILTAIDNVKILYEKSIASNILVRVEDARKRTWFGNTGKERLKGAGSVERDCKIWEDFLTDLGIDFEMVHPKNNKTKLSAEVFKKVTGYEGGTSQHSRDAAMLCVGF